eukprot:scaffold69293_cov34-Prasinocladus_malaysianus.AAC.1
MSSRPHRPRQAVPRGPGGEQAAPLSLRRHRRPRSSRGPAGCAGRPPQPARPPHFPPLTAETVDGDDDHWSVASPSPQNGRRRCGGKAPDAQKRLGLVRPLKKDDRDCAEAVQLRRIRADSQTKGREIGCRCRPRPLLLWPGRPPAGREGARALWPGRSKGPVSRGCKQPN